MNRTILLVDDEINVLNSFRRTLRKQLDIELANSAHEALEKIQTKQFAVIVSDMQMPEMNGLQLLQEVKERSPDTVRMMFTGNADQKTAVDAVNLGDVYRFINKPCSPQDLLIFIESALKQYDLIVAEKVLLNKTLKGVISVLTEVVSLVNPKINDHNSRISFHMHQLARAIKLKKHWSFEPMVQLSQLGYIIFPESTLQNVSDGLIVTEEDRQLFSQHPCLAHDLVNKIPRMSSIAQAILYQEKGFNGDGIPYDDIKGRDIPLGARMLKIVCDYVKLESAGYTPLEAIQSLKEQQELYDPSLLNSFKKTLTLEVPKIEVDVAMLNKAMVIEQEIYTNREQLIARKGQRVTEALMNIIHHCVENKAVSGTVLISIYESEENEDTASM